MCQAGGSQGLYFPLLLRRVGLVHLEAMAQAMGLEPSGASGPMRTGQPSSPCTSGEETHPEKRSHQTGPQKGSTAPTPRE